MPEEGEVTDLVKVNPKKTLGQDAVVCYRRTDFPVNKWASMVRRCYDLGGT